jgi:hypothetical protein
MSKTCVSVTNGAAVLIAPLVVMFVGCQSTPKTPGVPMPLKQRAECMYEVLKTMPGVSEPKLGYVTREGWSHPFLEYRADETNSWVQPTHFEAKRGDYDRYWFLALVPGIIDPRIGYFDIHVTNAVVEKWKTQCHVEVVVTSV